MGQPNILVPYIGPTVFFRGPFAQGKRNPLGKQCCMLKVGSAYFHNIVS